MHLFPRYRASISRTQAQPSFRQEHAPPKLGEISKGLPLLSPIELPTPRNAELPISLDGKGLIPRMWGTHLYDMEKDRELSACWMWVLLLEGDQPPSLGFRDAHTPVPPLGYLGAHPLTKLPTIR